MDEQRTLVLPDEPLPVRLMNTVWAEHGTTHDDLANSQAAESWLRSVGFWVPALTGRDAREARALRDAVRTAAAFVTHDERTVTPRAASIHAAIGQINWRAAHAPHHQLEISSGVVTHQNPSAAASVDDALAVLAAATVAFFSTPDMNTLRACMGPRCVLYFAKKHPRREWCDGACGNRARAARYYHRHHR